MAQLSRVNEEQVRFPLTHLAFNDLINFLKLGFGIGADFSNFFLKNSFQFFVVQTREINASDSGLHSDARGQT